MNGKVYSGGTGKVLQASAYVQEWKGKIDESGLTDVVLGLGLSAAAIRGSMEYGSIPKVKVKDSLKFLKNLLILRQVGRGMENILALIDTEILN
ncbi:Uncharacterised protein [Listeria fleischmannii subsp. fleischmannii]|uniref:Uncharacterized protein n=1 Tax=Listeria fleischmannii subsp. fleischmannii TaxID=1671902 RepID=A0A2X3GU78_9LIST|nr:hypothetical protein [Listeria fleischmannii]SQC71792.1 Uncharacterised protein [Listeria fleischmannii subsp. fleischmannii]